MFLQICNIVSRYCNTPLRVRSSIFPYLCGIKTDF